MKYGSCLLVLLLCQPVFAGRQVDSSSAEDRLQVLLSLNQRHPHSELLNRTHPRSAMELLEKASRIRAELGPLAHANRMQETAEIRIDYHPTQKIKTYDIKGLEAFKEALGEAVRSLFPPKQAIEIKDLVPDLQVISQNPALVSPFLRLLPLLYFAEDSTPRSSSVTRETLLKEVQEAEPFQLEQLYLTGYPLLLKKSAELLPLATKINSIKNQFYGRAVMRAFAKTIKVETLPTRTLIVRELPEAMRDLRSQMAQDCGQWSVPFHGEVKEAQAFWIYDDPSALPIGYLFAVLTQDGSGQALPYVVTSNSLAGELTAEDVQTIVVALSHHFWKTENIVTPDFKLNPALVNSSDMSKGLTFKGSAPYIAQLPQGWIAIDAIVESRPRDFIRFTNYYNGESVKRARLSKIPPLNPATVVTITTQEHFPKAEKTALWEMQVGAVVNPDKLPKDTTLAGLTHEQISYGYAVTHMPPDRVSEPQLLQVARTPFDPSTWTQAGLAPRLSWLALLHERQSNLLTAEGWQAAFAEADQDLAALVSEHPYVDSTPIYTRLYSYLLKHLANGLPQSPKPYHSGQSAPHVKTRSLLGGDLAVTRSNFGHALFTSTTEQLRTQLAWLDQLGLGQAVRDQLAGRGTRTSEDLQAMTLDEAKTPAWPLAELINYHQQTPSNSKTCGNFFK